MTFDPNARSFNYSIMSLGWKACIPVTGHLNRCRLTTNTANPTIPIANLAESWEFTKPGNYVIHLRKGIRWQDIPPVNGRELTSDDIAYHYHRLYGLGHGFTQRGPGAHYQFTPLNR